MQYPSANAQTQLDYRLNETERRMQDFLTYFFQGVSIDVRSRATTYWLFGKSTTFGTDKWQFHGSFQISNSGTGVSPYLNLVHTRGTASAPTATQDGDTIGYIAGTGYASNSTFYAGATIEFQSTDAWTSGAHGTKIVFKTTDDSGSTLTESGFIDTKGSWCSGRASLATNATSGFLYVPYTDGVPSGTADSFTGRYPIVIGKSGSTKQPYFYDGSAWTSIGGSSIKSIQRGQTQMSTTEDYKTVTITSVNTAKTMVSLLGTASFASGTVNDSAAYINLYDSTTLELHRYRDSSIQCMVSWEVIEFN